MSLALAAFVGLALGACQGTEAPGADTLVVSSDPELRRLGSELLPELARRSGLELREPVRVERRTREELEGYLRAKLDEELPPEEEQGLTRAYALLGLVPEDLDLRGLLLSVYTEQVAGFYDPDSTALFVLDDQAPEALRGLLVHELVHAVQDQNAPLDSLTDRARGNDRQVAAQAAIEGHATLVMLEHMLEAVQGRAVDLAEVPDFAAQLRPALEGVRSQYPALAGAPRVVQESILFPYLDGAGFVQALWASQDGRRVAPFGDHLPGSTEQVLHPDRFLGVRDEPTEVSVTVPGQRIVYSDGLGQLETRILLEERSGAGEGATARGWDGDRYVLLEGGQALVWVSVWDDEASRDAFFRRLAPALERTAGAGVLSSLEVGGRPVVVLRVGDVGEVQVGLDGPAPGAGGPR